MKMKIGGRVFRDAPPVLLFMNDNLPQNNRAAHTN